MTAQIIYSSSLDISEGRPARNPVAGLGGPVSYGSFYVRGTMGEACYAIWEQVDAGFYGLASWGAEIVDGELIPSSYAPFEAVGSSVDDVIDELERAMGQ